MKVFTYQTGHGEDANIHLVIAENQEKADHLAAEAEGYLGPDDSDFDPVCTEYDTSKETSYVIFCG